MVRTLHTNIYALYLIKLSKWFMLIMPIVALFYTDNGLDDFDIYLLQAIYSVSVAILEIPSGYMADVIGRKKSLVMGSILGTLGFVIYSFCNTFEGFLVAEVVLGLGGSFISGSDSALLYDSLIGMKKEHKYLQLEGRITSLGNFAETSAAIAGGLIAAFLSYRAVYICQGIVAAMAIPASCFLVEPLKEKVIVRPGIKHILLVCKESLVVNKRLSSTLLLSSIIGTATLCMAWTSQIYFVNMGLTEKIITPLWVLLNLTVAVVAAFASSIVRWLSKSKAIILIVMIIPLSYLFLGMLPLWPGVSVLLIFYTIRGYATPLLKDLTNSNCDSETRATVLSIRSMMIRICFAVLGPCIGTLSLNYSLQFALVISGIFLTFLSCGAVVYLFKIFGYKMKGC